MSDTSQGPGWWQASDGKWYAPETHPDYVPPDHPPPPAPGAEPSPGPGFWKGTDDRWHPPTEPRPTPGATKVRTRLGTASYRLKVIGILAMLGGFAMGVGMAEPETPREEDQFEQLMNVVWALMIGGFVLLCVGIAVGLIDRVRVGPNQQDQERRDHW